MLDFWLTSKCFGYLSKFQLFGVTTLMFRHSIPTLAYGTGLQYLRLDLLCSCLGMSLHLGMGLLWMGLDMGTS